MNKWVFRWAVCVLFCLRQTKQNRPVTPPPPPCSAQISAYRAQQNMVLIEENSRLKASLSTYKK